MLEAIPCITIMQLKLGCRSLDLMSYLAINRALHNISKIDDNSPHKYD